MPGGQSRIGLASDDGTKKVDVEARGLKNVLATEILDANGNQITDFNDSVYSVEITDDSNGNIEYIGWADPGTATSAAGWRIAKLTYSSNDNPSSILYADGNKNFDNTYDNRATYSYS